MNDILKAKAQLYLALMDADVNDALSQAVYMQALMNDPDIKTILATAMPKEMTNGEKYEKQIAHLNEHRERFIFGWQRTPEQYIAEYKFLDEGRIGYTYINVCNDMGIEPREDIIDPEALK